MHEKRFLDNKKNAGSVMKGLRNGSALWAWKDK